MSLEGKHPGDDVAAALARAKSLLSVVTDCYEAETGNFVVSGNYLIETILAADAMLENAKTSLAAMCEAYDSSQQPAPAAAPQVLHAAAPVQTAATQPAPPPQAYVAPPAPAVAPVPPAPEAERPIFVPRSREAEQPPSMLAQPQAMQAPMMRRGSYLSQFGPPESSPLSLSARAEQAAPTKGFVARMAQREIAQDRRATSYDELLVKLTAVADQAASHPQSAGGDPDLLPALEELRADLMKIKSVA